MLLTELESLLQPRHPFEAQHQAQQRALQQLTGAQREEMARLFRFGNAAFRYQQLATGEVTEDDYRDWLIGLPAGVQAAMEREGFAKCQNSLPLRRHALERRDVGYEAFIQSVLSPADWAAWEAEKVLHASGQPSVD